MKVAVVGSRSYEDKDKIKKLIFELKKKFGEELEIVSGGAQNGADKFARKFAIELGCKYKEFNPAHTNRNLYSAMPDYYYGKAYHVSQLFHRNRLLIKYSDVVVVFIPDNVKSNGSWYVVNESKKLNKPVVVIN